MPRVNRFIFRSLKLQNKFPRSSFSSFSGGAAASSSFNETIEEKFNEFRAHGSRKLREIVHISSSNIWFNALVTAKIRRGVETSPEFLGCPHFVISSDSTSSRSVNYSMFRGIFQLFSSTCSSST